MQRRGFLRSLLALAAAPALAGFNATRVANAIDPVRYVNVRDFGAVGDGIHDDGPALQRALAACNTVYLPAGTYAIRSSTQLVGLGSGVTRLVGA